MSPIDAYHDGDGRTRPLTNTRPVPTPAPRRSLFAGVRQAWNNTWPLIAYPVAITAALAVDTRIGLIWLPKIAGLFALAWVVQVVLWFAARTEADVARRRRLFVLLTSMVTVCVGAATLAIIAICMVVYPASSGTGERFTPYFLALLVLALGYDCRQFRQQWRYGARLLRRR